MTTPRTPKHQFQQSPARASAWRELVVSDEFVSALNYALLQFVHESTPGQVYDAQAASHRLEGAKRFSVVLQTLGDTSAPAERTTESVLDYKGAPPPKPDPSVPAHLVPHKFLDPKSQP